MHMFSTHHVLINCAYLSKHLLSFSVLAVFCSLIAYFVCVCEVTSGFSEITTLGKQTVVQGKALVLYPEIDCNFTNKWLIQKLRFS